MADAAKAPYAREKLHELQRLLDTGDGTLTRHVVRDLITTAIAGAKDTELLDQLSKLAQTHVVEITPPVGVDRNDDPSRLSVNILEPDEKGWEGWGGTTVIGWEAKKDDTLRGVLRDCIAHMPAEVTDD